MSHSLYSVAVVDSIGKSPVDIEGVAVTFIHRGLVELIGMRAEAFPCIGSLSNPYCFVATLYVSNFALAFPQPVLIAQWLDMGVGGEVGLRFTVYAFSG